MPWSQRHEGLKEVHGEGATFFPADMRNAGDLRHILGVFQPEVIVHLAEQPSAPFSMIDSAHAALTQECNIVGSLNLLFAVRDICPQAHILKLGTMGEYGTPEIRIPEGIYPPRSEWYIADAEATSRDDMDWGGDLAGMQFPRAPGSVYHASKVADSVNAEMLCRLWRLRATDVMQGVVYGTRVPAMGEDPRLRTRFDFDAVFGTAIHRFCAQAIAEQPITPYGKGHQKRGFLPLVDSMQCLALLMDNPPGAGEYRVVNQLESVYDLTVLANAVADAYMELGGDRPQIRHIGNPRVELEEHTYEVDTSTLKGLGYQPTTDMDAELGTVLNDLMAYSERIVACADALTPTVRWAK